MISPLDSRILDRNSESLGISVESLMDNAGRELAKAVDTYAEGRILFVCGSGNNGGDGYAASEYLTKDADYCYFREPKSELCVKKSKDLLIFRYSPELLKEYDTIVDCVLGTGTEGGLREPYREYIDHLNSLHKKIISCDVPTGFGSGRNVIADVTVTFHDMKDGMNEKDCGKIVVCDIGIPKDAELIVNKGDFLRYPIPESNSHKGQNGRLVIVGGGPYVGAPACSGMAAIRTGADLVTILTPKRSFLPIASMSASYIVKELSSEHLCMEDVQTIMDACDSADSILIGPGIGRHPESVEAVRAIVQAIGIPIVIDADGISNIAEWVSPREGMVFTPHGKELARLIGKVDPTDEDVQSFCNGAVILRKGETDRIYDGKRLRQNRTGCAGMTVGGTGDVLAGIVAGLLSKGMSTFDAACLGAHICGLAGEMAFEEHSFGMNAEDVISHIGHVLKEGLE